MSDEPDAGKHVWYQNGYMAEVAIYDAALTSAEINILARGYSPRFVRPGNLLFYVPLVRGEAFLIPRRVIEYDWRPSLEIEVEKEECMRWQIVMAGHRFSNAIDTLLLRGDYFSLVERLEIPELFRWSARENAAVLFVVMLFIILLLS